ncbi:putative Fructokinase [Roseobacter sp. SK209-2-6]|uniref:carbohydrate kinase family protein n=1 Tax=Roseobacter sp. SK209-2-6 TaxID=388739 RepID=UPI0000F3CE3C|nr:carbohydrate kinase [Roseobacter sp. SK209-2-6]EBA15891.1 putative Fructokinase [Roseobacter sp. SK209-2-6]
MILCCGEALIDMLPAVTEQGDPCFRPLCGGAAFNSAIALGRLGAPVALVSGLSEDQFGRQLHHELTASAVETGLAIVSDRATTLAYVSLQDGDASYRFYDHGSAMREITLADMPLVPKETLGLLFGGISLCNGPFATTLCSYAEKVADQHLVMLDLNIRPGFAEDEEAYRQRLERMVRLSDVVKLSEEDMEHFFPSDSRETQDKLKGLFDLGPRLVLQTKGARGVMALRPDGPPIVVPGRKVVVSDTVGAGDSFNAGFLTYLNDQDLLNKEKVALLSDEHLQRALTFAVQVASITVSRAGANPPRRAELG